MYIVGYAKYISAKKSMIGTIDGAVAKAHKSLSKMLADRVRTAVPGSIKGAVKPGSDPAGVDIHPTPGYAIGRIMGASGRYGWYAAQQFAGSTGRQFEPWVGDNWVIGSTEGMPYYMGPVINASVEDVMTHYDHAADRVAMPAYPIGTFQSNPT